MADATYVPKVYHKVGGDEFIVASGGLIDVETGGALKFAGADRTAALSTAPAAVAAGYKLARGTVTPGTASDTVVTGLTTVVAAVASLKGAPTINMTIVAGDIGNQAGAPAAGSILIKSYKPTAAGDTAPVAATAFVAVDWIAVGT